MDRTKKFIQNNKIFRVLSAAGKRVCNVHACSRFWHFPCSFFGGTCVPLSNDKALFECVKARSTVRAIELNALTRSHRGIFSLFWWRLPKIQLSRSLHGLHAPLAIYVCVRDIDLGDLAVDLNDVSHPE